MRTCLYQDGNIRSVGLEKNKKRTRMENKMYVDVSYTVHNTYEGATH